MYEVDLERHPELEEIFASRDTSRILSELEYLIDKGPIDDPASLLFLDEIQATPSAIAALRSLHEDRPDLPVIAAGGARRDVTAATAVYGFVPGAVGDKFKYSRVDSDARSRDVKQALDLLVMAWVVRRVTHTDATGLPLGATLKESAIKTYFLDVGLMNAACGIDRLTPERVADARSVNEGAMAEQFIAQHLPLLAPDNRAYTPTYWLREGRTNNAEVDSVHQLGSDVAPIEVKAGKSGSLKSLLELVSARHCDRALRFDTNPPQLQQVSHTRSHSADVIEFTLLSLPLYMVEQAPRLWRDVAGDRTL